VGRALTPLLGADLFYVVVLPAIVFSAWYCGLAPTALATLLTLLAITYWRISHVHPLALMTATQAIGMFVFLVACATIAMMGEARRRENEILRQTQGDLEDRVKQRTTELDVANQGLRELTARLMQLQDDERRRIARELHDSVGQMLAALSMNLTTVGVDLERLRQTAAAITDSTALVEEMNKEVRTISYLLHPPLLDEAGLASALRWYIDGFSQRSKIDVDLEVPDNFGRYPRELEMVIFRTIQECLTNIHRHSGSRTARICISQFDGELRLQVEDQGAGISNSKLQEVASSATPGVGIRGMRERLRQLGGTLEINSNGKGTVVNASLPVATTTTAAA